MKNKPPFEGIFGNTAALRTVEFLITTPDIRFNISDLAQLVEVSRQTMSKVLSNLLEFGLVKAIDNQSGVLSYQLNPHSPYVQLLEKFNNLLIEDLIGLETLYEIGDHFEKVDNVEDLPGQQLSEQA